MMRGGIIVAIVLALAACIGGFLFAGGWFGSAQIEEEASFIVPRGATLTSVANNLEAEGYIESAGAFLLRAKVFGGSSPIQAGEYQLAEGASPADILQIFQTGGVVRRLITIPEGMPSIMVVERLMAQDLLSGELDVPEEGSLLPESYDFERGEERSVVLARMQWAMTRALDELWDKRSPDTVVTTPEEAVILASIVEKETGLEEERRMVAGLYSNRVRRGMLLQADPTIIYPLTKGKPLGRRIRQSEIQAVNDYNTYTMTGLPKGPITNPGRASIEAVLNPAKTEALYMVADGTGGHMFGETLAEHNANVEKWYAIRRERGEM